MIEHTIGELKAGDEFTDDNGSTWIRVMKAVHIDGRTSTLRVLILSDSLTVQALNSMVGTIMLRSDRKVVVR